MAKRYHQSEKDRKDESRGMKRSYRMDHSDSEMRMRDIKMPEVRSMGDRDACCFSRQDWDGSMGYERRQDMIAESDRKKLHGHLEENY